MASFRRFPRRLLLIIVSIFLCTTVESQAVRGKAHTAVEVVEVGDDTPNAATIDILQYDLDDPRCFESTEELRQAVHQYERAETFDAQLASKYGWPIGHWCVSNLQDFSNLFVANAKHHRYLNEPLQDWDMSRATDLSGMFQNCHWFNQDLSTWDVGEVTDMSRMFAAARNFNQDIGSWDTSQVRDMSYMFLHAFSFNQPSINQWNIQSLLTTEGMFRDARAFDSSQLKWDVSHVPNTRMMVSSISGVSLNLRGQGQQQTVIKEMDSL